MKRPLEPPLPPRSAAVDRVSPGARRAIACALIAVACAGCASRKGPEPTPYERARDVDPPARVATAGVEPGSANPAPLDPAAAPASAVIHVLRPGETLWRVAQRYGVDVDTLARENGIADPTDIPAWFELRIPGGAATDLGLAWPVAGRDVLSGFGAPRGHRRHLGLDVRGRRGEPVRAAADGVVTYAGSMRGYGKVVIVEHGDGIETLYAHNRKLDVDVGDRIRVGETLARIGASGNATTEHVHFEVRIDGVAVDPLRHLVDGVERASR